MVPEVHFHRALQVLGMAVGLAACAELSATSSADTPEQSDEASASRPSRRSGTGGAAAGDTSNVRKPTLAGTYYPKERSLIVAEVQRMLRTASAGPSLADKPLALVVPHARWSDAGEAMVAGLSSVKPGDFRRVVLVAPPHGEEVDGVVIPHYKAYHTPLGAVPVCPEAFRLIDRNVILRAVGTDARDQVFEAELPLLQSRLGLFCVIPMIIGKIDEPTQKELAKRISLFNNQKTLFVFMSDFIQYGLEYKFTPFGENAARARNQITPLENRGVDLLKKRDVAGFRGFIDATGANICGWRGLSVMLELLQRVAPRAQGTVLAHYSTLDLTQKPDANATWYASLAYVASGGGGGSDSRPLGAPPRPKAAAGGVAVDDDLGNKLVRIARAALRTELGMSSDLEFELSSLPSGGAAESVQPVFVTLTKAGETRGSAGQSAPEFRLPEAAIHAAVGAAFPDSKDPKDKPLQAKEIDEVAIEVTIVGPPRPVASYREIVAGSDGVVFEKGKSRGVVLPNEAASQKWTLIRTLSEAARRAGLSAKAWRDPDAKFSVFVGQVFREEAPQPASLDSKPKSSQ
jgi:AmmeMemoRadiSam system protein B/uncharacterized protein (TIGR00296 family)